MLFAARVTDLLLCPIGGAGVIMPPCCLTVLIGFLLAARRLDPTLCALGPDVIMKPCSTTVLTGFMSAARVTDMNLVHQAAIIPPACTTVLIG